MRRTGYPRILLTLAALHRRHDRVVRRASLPAVVLVIGCGGDPGTTPPAPAVPIPESPAPAPEPGPGADIFAFPLRAVAVSGNWDNTQALVYDWRGSAKRQPLVPAGFFEWLDGLHVNWVMLSVSIHYNDSLDSTVRRDSSEDLDVPTFADDALRKYLREFREHGLNVYLTLAFEAFEAERSERPVARWLLGDPGVPDRETGFDIQSENWPWSPRHREHARFTAEFWENYTQQAVHFAAIAEGEGVALYSLGTETDRLFRTRPDDGHFSNDYGTELRTMVDRVRAVYTGRLTYDAHAGVFLDFDWYGRGAGGGHLWEDLDLDIVGISGWIPLTQDPPTAVMSVSELEASYAQVFRDYLVPLAGRNPGRPVVFAEYGALDVLEAPADPARWGGQEFVFSDANGNGVDDGLETQANIFEAFFNTVDLYPGVVNGAFFWDNGVYDDQQWTTSEKRRTRNFAIRGKPAEQVVRTTYTSYLDRER